jgi:hypothetical protein
MACGGKAELARFGAVTSVLLRIQQTFRNVLLSSSRDKQYKKSLLEPEIMFSDFAPLRSK